MGGCGEGEEEETCNFRARKICEKGGDGAGEVAIQIPFGQLLKTCVQTRIKKGFLGSLNQSRKNKDNSGEKKNPGEITERFDRYIRHREISQPKKDDAAMEKQREKKKRLDHLIPRTGKNQKSEGEIGSLGEVKTFSDVVNPQHSMDSS